MVLSAKLSGTLGMRLFPFQEANPDVFVDLLTDKVSAPPAKSEVIRNKMVLVLDLAIDFYSTCQVTLVLWLRAFLDKTFVIFNKNKAEDKEKV